ncbi:MAG: complex I subunit 1 family protein [Bacteroidia bacterium]
MPGYLALLGLLLYGLLAVYAERKIAAWIQDRLGPTETGPYGLLQTFADLLKLLRKSETVPEEAVRPTFRAAPLLSFAALAASLTWLPFLQPASSSEFGLWLASLTLILQAATLFLGGWASGSKYALLGAYRLLVLVLAYELMIGLLLLTLLAHYGTFSLAAMAAQQKGTWGLFQSPFLLGAAAAWLWTALLTAHRAPFDLPETESELVAGALTEYSGIRFALFMLSEYGVMLLQGLWFGYGFLGGQGWLGALLVVSLLLIVRWAWPRWRPDQVLTLAWTKGIPLTFFLWLGELLWQRFIGKSF